MIAISKHSDIPGWGDFHHCYRQLIAQLPENAAILEIGAGFGRGTWTFLDVMKPTQTLTVLDSFKLSSQHLWQQFCINGSELTLDVNSVAEFERLTAQCTQRELFTQSVSQHRNYSQIKRVYAIASDLYMGFNQLSRFDLVFLDGAHEYDVVSRELDYFKHSFLLAGHDYDNNDCDDVKRAVNDFMVKNTNKTIAFYPQEDVYVIHDREFKLCETSEPLEYTS